MNVLFIIHGMIVQDNHKTSFVYLSVPYYSFSNLILLERRGRKTKETKGKEVQLKNWKGMVQEGVKTLKASHQ